MGKASNFTHQSAVAREMEETVSAMTSVEEEKKMLAESSHALQQNLEVRETESHSSSWSDELQSRNWVINNKVFGKWSDDRK